MGTALVAVVIFAVRGYPPAEEGTEATIGDEHPCKRVDSSASCKASWETVKTSWSRPRV